MNNAFGAIEMMADDTTTPDTSVTDVEYNDNYPIWIRAIEATGAYVYGYVVYNF